MNHQKEVEKRSNQYDESGFWDKCSKYGKKIGEESLGKVLNLYYATESDNCSTKDKTIIYGALAYLVSPIDLIPDLTPFVGYTDDIAIIMWALARVAGCVDSEVKRKTTKKLKEWFE